jgi:aspartyl-tRNA(Asn)/glutamyl-tRNA(Gln) amidotransferase subunit B
MIDNQADSPELQYLEFIEQNLTDKDFAKWVTNSFVNIIEPLRIGSKKFVKLEWVDTLPVVYKLINDDKLSSSRAKDLIQDIFTLGSVPKDIEEFATGKGYIQVSDEGEITKIVDQVLKDNPQAAEDVKNGEMKAIGFLVGQVMKTSRGKANPSLAQDLIKKQLKL